MSLINSKSKPADQATEALDQALEWVRDRQQDEHGPRVSGGDMALISIAASLREIAQKTR